MTLRIVELDAPHDCKAFKCSENSLTSWFRLHARTSAELNATKVFVAVDDGEPTRVLGYYAFVMGEIRLEELPDDIPDCAVPDGGHPLGVVLLARFATDKRYEGRQVGAKMLHDLLLRTADLGDRIGCRGLEVDALTQNAQGFYLHNYPEFVVLRDSSLHLFLPMETIREVRSLVGG